MNAAIGNCLDCGSALRRVHSELYDTRFGVPGSYAVGKCIGCDLVQLDPPPRPAELQQFYEKYYNFSGSSNFYTRVRDFLFNSFLYRWWTSWDGDIAFQTVRSSRRGQKLLELGCNEGRNLVGFRRNGFLAEGHEINPVAARSAKERGFHIWEGDPLEINPPVPFDVVVLPNVIEHTLNPEEVLRLVSNLLAPGGEVWISCPNYESEQRLEFGNSWINWHVPFHIFHFTAGTLTRLLEKAGFVDIRISNVTPALWVVQSMVSRRHATKGIPTSRMRNAFRILFSMIILRIFRNETLRRADRAGRGDCILVRGARSRS